MHLNDKKSADKKFILEDLDATHLLIKGEVRDEITRKVDEWMDEVSIMCPCCFHVFLLLLAYSYICSCATFCFATRMYFPILNELERTWTLHSLTHNMSLKKLLMSYFLKQSSEK